MKNPLLFCMLFFGLSAIGNDAFAQTRTCDLELKFNTPQNNQTFSLSPGDTVPVNLKIINHGPDDLLPGDTVHLFFSYYTPQNTWFYPNNGIPSGDSAVSFAYVDFFGDSSIGGGTDTITVCAHLDAQTNFIDPNSSNDTPDCIHFFVLQNAGIEPSAVLQNRLVISPNPAQAATCLSFNLKQPGKVELKLTDVIGRTVFYKDYGMLQGKEKLKIDVSALPSGMYFIHLSEGAKQVTGKLVVR